MRDRQNILVIDDDPAITSALAMLLDREGRTIILCADVESAELALARHFLTRIRSRRPSCRIVLMTGLVTDTLQDVAMGFGAAAVLSKPFELRELEGALQLRDGGEGAYEVVRIPSLDELLQGGLLTTEFQPIVTAQQRIFGFEALAGIQGELAGGDIAELFDYAAKRQRLPG